MTHMKKVIYIKKKTSEYMLPSLICQMLHFSHKKLKECNGVMHPFQNGTSSLFLEVFQLCHTLYSKHMVHNISLL